MSAWASRILRKNRSGRYGVPSEQPVTGSRKVSLSPKEVRNRKFHQSLTGYDAKEVSLFLKDVALELEKISMQNIHLSEANKSLDRQVAQLRVKISLTSDKGTGSGRDAGSHDRQDALLHEARLKAEEIVRQAKMEAAVGWHLRRRKRRGRRGSPPGALLRRPGPKPRIFCTPPGKRPRGLRASKSAKRKKRPRKNIAGSFGKQKPPRRRYCRRHRSGMRPWRQGGARRRGNSRKSFPGSSPRRRKKRPTRS